MTTSAIKLRSKDLLHEMTARYCFSPCSSNSADEEELARSNI